MAIQINEVIIRAVVSQPDDSGSSQEPECPTSSGSSESELVEKVLEIIREKKER